MFLMRGRKQKNLVNRDVKLMKIKDIVPQLSDGKIVSYDIESHWEEGHQFDSEFHNLEFVHQNPKYMIKIDDTPVRTFSDIYTPVQDIQLHEVVTGVIKEKGLPILDDVDFSLSKYGTVGILTLERGRPILESRPGELYDYHVVWSNSYDGSRAVYVRSCWERLICSNGLVATHSAIESRLLHIQKEKDAIYILANIAEMLEKVLSLRQKEINFYNDMVEREMTIPQIVWVLNKLGLSKGEAQKLSKHGLKIEWVNGEIKSVLPVGISPLFHDVIIDEASEWAFFNAIGSLSRNVRDIDRQLELLNRILSLIVKSRYIAVDVEAGIL